MANDPPYKDRDRRTDERVTDLLRRMTVAEKVGQMIQLEPAWGDLETLLRRHHAGSFAMVRDISLLNRLQRIAVEESRLGIPLFFGYDAVHGHAFWPGATVFPTQLALSCAWDTSLAKRIGEVTAREMRVTGQHQAYAPVLDLPRDLRWGRVDETFGEAQFLVGELGAATVSGLQGRSLSDPESVFATCKHLVGYGDTSGGRDAAEGHQTRRALLSIFLPPFVRALEAGCRSFMIAYHAIDGVPCSANRWLLRTLFRQTLGFSGFMQTDYDNVGRFVRQMHVAHDMGEAVARAVNAGTDMLNGTPQFLDVAEQLVTEGAIEMASIDRACEAILRVKFELGLFDDPERCYADPARVSVVLGCPEHRRVALEAARESLVLLKNNGTLPLDQGQLRRITLLGQNADDIFNQLGDWSFGQVHGNIVYGEDHPRESVVTVLDGLRAVAGNRTEIRYEPGCDVLHEELSYYDSIERQRPYPREVYRRIPLDEKAVRDACSDADCIVAVVGDSIAQNGEQRDRAHPELTADQLEMLRIAREAGAALVVVVISGKPLCMPEVADHADAILCAFNPGIEGGRAIAEALFGEINPQGKLTISWPKEIAQQPVHLEQTAGWHSTQYVDLDTQPQWVFGYGLSYTNFAYSNLRLSPASMPAPSAATLRDRAAGFTATVTVSNGGARAGTEIVQLYLNDLVSSVTTPTRQLAGFARVELAAGESADVSIHVPLDTLALITPELERVVEPGEFEILVGGSSGEEDPLRAAFSVTPGDSDR